MSFRSFLSGVNPLGRTLLFLTLILQLQVQSMSAIAANPLSMTLDRSDASAYCYVQAGAGTPPDSDYDSNSDSDAGSGTPESAFADRYFFSGGVDASWADPFAYAASAGWQESFSQSIYGGTGV